MRPYAVACVLLLLSAAGGIAMASGRGELGAAAGAPSTAASRAPRAADISSLPDRTKATSTAQTNCGACHGESSWSDAKFDHLRTGFALAGSHEKVGCQGCHPRGYTVRVAETCAGCHRDRHAGQLGLHCEGCHDERSWRDTLFGTGGHERTAFPLTGRHAAIPCQECHGDMRERSFARAPLGCVDCHRADVAAAAVRSIDHTAAHFGDACQTCHSTWAFSPARFAAHDLCFTVSTGSHRGLPCRQCHSNPSALALNGLCADRDVRCVSCHTHGCDVSDRRHQNVMGYQCLDQKCFECHRTVPSR